MRLSGAVVLVTGASSGIGAATASALATAGARVLLTGRDAGRLSQVAAHTGGVVLAADLAAPGGTAALAGAATAAAGSQGLDVLVNNAGTGWAGPFPEMTAEQAAGLIATNLTAPVELTRLLLPGMVARGRGHVLFVSSIAGVTGVEGEAVYSATKAGLATFAESLGYETRPHGVRVSVVVPGVIDTPFFDRRGRPYARTRPAPIPPQRVATAIVSALERGRPVAYVPRWLRVPAWVHGVAPGVFRALAARFGGSG
jgi:short-subunit dehydrogenase